MGDNDKVSVESLKEQGNAAVRNNKYEEAILHYTYAIKLEPTNYTLYSNRSFAFLKVQQYYFAMEDANETIRLNPSWAKGYFRKAEIEFATYQFNEAVTSYQKALELKPEDSGIINGMRKAIQEEEKDKRADAQIPWVGSGIGIVIGVIIVIADYICTSKPTLTHPILMALLTITISMMGYGIARGVRYYVKCQRNSLIEVPINLFDDDNKPEDKVESEEKTSNHTRYSKSQARQRYKKGKA
ncbi:hypothetical protein FQR65_LT06216 [Abscondita terminalis]|nr:hypothetical protein FQR65_LT06216 [Abscondita terminalis]